MGIHRNQVSVYGLPMPPDTGNDQSWKLPRIPKTFKKGYNRSNYSPGTIPRGGRTIPEQYTAKPREIMSLVADYARGRRTVILRYRKKTENNRVVTREIEPYSIRVKATRYGPQRYLYGVCTTHGGIHSFIISRILSVSGTVRNFYPKWRVEF